MKQLVLPILILLLTTVAVAQETRIVWQPVAAGVWSARVGTPEQLDLLKAAGSKPRTEALGKLGAAELPAALKDSAFQLSRGRVFLRFPLREQEELFGFGLNFQNVRQRGRTMTLHVDHYGGKDNGRTHAPVPFYVSSAGYGVLVNSARYITVYAGTGLRQDSSSPPKIKDRNTGSHSRSAAHF